MKNQFPVKLDRPLVFFDIESTGTSPKADRIVEIALIRMRPGCARDARAFRVNPGMPIPPEVSAIHGIGDADVKGCPPFRGIAGELLALFGDADIAGFNILRFDLPMLVEEFLRCDIEFDIENRRIIDVQRIFHRREPRDLSAALAFYCSEFHLGAHGAMADADATLRVLEGQFERYPDLPADMDRLHEYCNQRDPSWVDRAGKLRWSSGKIVINFGKLKGVALEDLIREDPGFVKWMLRSEFPRDTRRIVEEAANGRWPSPPAGEQRRAAQEEND
jgi:DNA polymerase-3 subunit epsilon